MIHNTFGHDGYKWVQRLLEAEKEKNHAGDVRNSKPGTPKDILKHDSTVSREPSWVWAAVWRRAEHSEHAGRRLRVGQRLRRGCGGEPEPH